MHIDNTISGEPFTETPRRIGPDVLRVGDSITALVDGAEGADVDLLEELIVTATYCPEDNGMTGAGHDSQGIINIRAKDNGFEDHYGGKDEGELGWYFNPINYNKFWTLTSNLNKKAWWR